MFLANIHKGLPPGGFLLVSDFRRKEIILKDIVYISGTAYFMGGSRPVQGRKGLRQGYFDQ